MGPLVSVVVATYNQAGLIAETLRSIASDSYPDIEIIVTDDASVDGTAAVAREVLALSGRPYQILENDVNVGPSNNVVRGIRVARGAFVATFSGDDLFLPGKIQRQVDALTEDEEIHAVYHDMEVFWPGVERSPRPWSAIVRPRVGGARTLIRHGCFPCTPSLMYRSECLNEITTAGMPAGADWLMVISATMGGRIEYIPEVLGRYRRHSGNITNESGFQDAFVALAHLEGRYPRLQRDIRLGRARILMQEAHRLMLMGKDGDAVYYARHALSIRTGWPPKAALFVWAAAAGINPYKLPVLGSRLRRRFGGWS